MATFKLKADLPTSTRNEITRVLAIASGLRTTEEAAFIAQIDQDYLYNEVLLRNAANEIFIAQGHTVPDGVSGYAAGGFFTKSNAAAGENPTYQNVGDATTAVFVGVGGRVAAVSLTSAQIKALNATPIALVAAPGAGKLIIVDEVLLKMSFLTAAYTGSNNLEIRYTDGSGAKATADFDKTAFLNIASGTAYQVSKGVVTALIPVANAAIVAVVPTADPAAGSGTISGFVRYHTVTL